MSDVGTECGPGGPYEAGRAGSLSSLVPRGAPRAALLETVYMTMYAGRSPVVRARPTLSYAAEA